MIDFSLINCSSSKNNIFINIDDALNNNKRITKFSGSIGKFMGINKRQKKKVTKEVIKRMAGYAKSRLNRLKNFHSAIVFKGIHKTIRFSILEKFYKKGKTPRLALELTTSPHNGCKRKKERRVRQK